MRLLDLEPRWFALEAGGARVGLTFLCPCCRTQRIGVSFHHAGREAIEDEYIHAHSPDTDHIWTLSGDNFVAVTLSPSVDASKAGHWHGWVTNGEVK